MVKQLSLQSTKLTKKPLRTRAEGGQVEPVLGRPQPKVMQAVVEVKREARKGKSIFSYLPDIARREQDGLTLWDELINQRIFGKLEVPQCLADGMPIPND